MKWSGWIVATVAAAVGAARGESDGKPLPTIHEVIEARTDLWGDAALREPDGPSYEFFRDLLPPPRWVNTDFRHYPIVLSAPRAVRKARLVSSGAAVNARANKPPMWHEQGVPVSFFIGDPAEPFGENLARLETPTYQEGYLPVVGITYRHKGAAYREEAFAPVDEASAAHGTLMLRFAIGEGGGENTGVVEARFGSESALRADGGNVLNEEGESLVAFGDRWRWDADRKTLVAELDAERTAELAIFTEPADPRVVMSGEIYDQRKTECVHAWNDLLNRSARFETPEPIVNDAWRSMLIGSYMTAVGDRPHYSAGNAYGKIYEGECGDTLRSLMLFGELNDAPAMLKPLLEFNRQATRFHAAGHKLQILADVYWLTRNAQTVRDSEPLWRPSVELILSSREADSGLLPKDNYAGDIKTQVYSLSSNAACWRGLRDMAAVLDDMGEQDVAASLRKEATAYRDAILAAVARSEKLGAQPPFIPIALLSDEPAHDPLTATRQGSYYDLMCPYVIGSEVFGQGSEREDWLLGYLQNHGGLAMGMMRTEQHQGQFKDEPGVCPLYTMRYTRALLRRDEREPALVGFYGQLAQGMTRGTFIGGEANKFLHGDADGRSFYLPPNSTSNACWLVTLRRLLVQDWDLDEDSEPDTLRLLFAAPRRWLADGKEIHVERAPTAFGEVSLRAESKLSTGYVDIFVTPPPRAPETMLLRAPLPSGWQVESVKVDENESPIVGGDTVDLSGRSEPTKVRFKVKLVK